MSSGSKSSFSCWRTSIASRKPIASNARDDLGPFLPRRAVGPLEAPAVHIADERRFAAFGREILDRGEEVADAIVGEARLVAVRQFDETVVDDDGLAARVDDAALAAPAGVRGGDLELDVLRVALDLVPDGAAGVDGAERQAGEVGEEDLVEVDDDRVAHQVQRLDLQRHDDRVGVRRFDRFRRGRAGLGLVADVAADQVHAVADAAEDEDPLIIIIQRGPAGAEAAGDGDRGHERLVELLRLDLHVDVVVFLMELEEPVDLAGALDELGEVAKLLFRGVLGAGLRGRGGEGEQCRQREREHELPQHNAPFGRRESLQARGSSQPS